MSRATDFEPQLVWFDPGISTGVCIVEIDKRWLQGEGDPDFKDLGKAIQFRYAEQTGRLARQQPDVQAHHLPPFVRGMPPRGPVPSVVDYEEYENIARCEELMDLYPRAAWGYEDFIPRKLNRSRAFLAPVRVFSALQQYEHLQGYGRTPFVQSASLAMDTATDDRLKAAGLYFEGMPHSTDAARHVATFLRSARKTPAVRNLAWPEHFKMKG